MKQHNYKNLTKAKCDFIFDIVPDKDTIVVIDANAQGAETKATNILKVEFPNTYAQLRKHLLGKEYPYGKCFLYEERHYKLVVIFGMANKYGINKDTVEQVSYVTNSLLTGIVKKFGTDKVYHSLVPYAGNNNVDNLFSLLDKQGAKWFFYKN